MLASHHVLMCTDISAKASTRCKISFDARKHVYRYIQNQLFCYVMDRHVTCLWRHDSMSPVLWPAHKIQASCRFVCLFVCLLLLFLFFYVFEWERANVRLALELNNFIVLSHRLGRHATLLPNKCVTAYNYPECQAFLGGNLLSPSPLGRGKFRHGLFTSPIFTPWLCKNGKEMYKKA